jgi:archaellum component FlaC
MNSEEIKAKAIDRLGEKVEELLKNYKELKSFNDELSKEVATLKAQNEAKDTQINKLEEELMLKELEVEEMVGKIEEVLSR